MSSYRSDSWCYGQWQTTDKGGPAVTPAEAQARYSVTAVGFATNVLWPQRKVSLGLKYFKEFSSRSTFQGDSAQVSASIGFGAPGLSMAFQKLTGCEGDAVDYACRTPERP